MPLFEFRCCTCDRDFELLVRAGDSVACPTCGAQKVEKLLSESAAPVTGSARSLPIAPSCPPGNSPCGPGCCRL